MSIAPLPPREIVPTRERLRGVVQSVGRRPHDITRRPAESALVFGLFTLAYTVIGYWLVVDMHVVGFETLDRFNRAVMISHNEPPKLSSIGFDYPPLAVILIAPLGIVTALSSSLVVVPLASSVFAGATMTFLNTMMRRAQVIGPMRAAILVALGANPLVVMYAATGARSFVTMSFVIAAIGALFAWYVTADIRFVMISGLAFSVAALTGYGSLVWFGVSLVMVMSILARLGADGTEIEGTSVGFASPTAYAIALWSAFNFLLLGNPVTWLTDSSDSASSGGLGAYSVGEIARGTLDLLVHGAPLALVVLPALLIVGLAGRNTFALWLGVMLLLAVVTPGAAVLLRLTDSPMVMSNAVPILLLSVVGALWLARSSVEQGPAVAVALVLGLLASIPWTFTSMETFQRQGIERAFHDAVATGESQEGATTLDGTVVGYDKERDMADFITAHVRDQDAVLTDNAATYAVMLLTGRPDLFFDRVDQSDGPWGEVARDPGGEVQYLLLSTEIQRDLLSQLYPAASSGNDPVLSVVHGNDRYTLVSVPASYRYGALLDSADDLDGDGVLDSEEIDATRPAVPVGPSAPIGGWRGQTGEAPTTTSFGESS